MQVIFDRLSKIAPISVMVKAVLENILSADRMNTIFRENAVNQSERQLLFSSIVELMSLVVCRAKPSVHAAFLHLPTLFSVSAKSVYNKISKVETQVSRALVTETASQMKQVIDEMAVANPSPVPGYEVRILDGNHHPASQRRLKVLRNVAAGPLPGLTLVVYDPVRDLVVDCLPCEDGHRQERALLMELFGYGIEPGVVWIADRNFCTAMFMFELDVNQAFFVVRHHKQVVVNPLGDYASLGRVETGEVFERQVEISGVDGEKLVCRQVTIKLDEATTDGDTEISLLTNLPSAVEAPIVAQSYRSRWNIENVNLKLVKFFDSEQTSLGYPPATLFAFAVSLVAFNTVAVIHMSLQAAHGEKGSPENVSGYYLALDLRDSETALQLIDDKDWADKYASLTPKELASELIRLAKNVDLSRYPKFKRGPKKPPTKRTRFKKKPHVSTHKLLQSAKPRKK